MTKGTSPASSGPAGSYFEGQVGAFYLLSLLEGAEPRGLPATTIDRVEFQRAAEGRPLDDVIVYARDGQGKPAVLEVQVKRAITFAPNDPIFRSVVGQMAKASLKPEFLNTRYELGIAISRTSHKIDGAYQDVLTWARQLGDVATFINRINRPGSANDDMRSFVKTFTEHLGDAGSAHDDETVWQLLRRLQIFVFDFTAPGSASEALAKERAVRALHPDDTPRAGDLWATLIELAIKIASSGGDRARDQLIEDLRQQSFRLTGDRRFLSARAALAEASRHALADIGDRVGGVTLTRHDRVASVHAALDGGRYVEIRGDAGVGKSGVLKHLAEQMAAEAQVIVLSPGRTIPRGWLAMRATLGFDGSARDLLSDMAGNGGAALFVDGLDFYGEGEQRTVVDLVREAAEVPGFSVIATARRDFGIAGPSWLPADVLDQLGRAGPVVINELSDAETDELRNAAPQLIALLADNHPARPVARNLFRLARLASRPSDAPVPRTEVEMAEQWWQTADGENDENRRERARLLKALAEQALSRAEQLDASRSPANAVDALVESETLRDLGNDRVAFRHDVLRDWAIANLLFSDPALAERLPLDQPAPASLIRGVELAARMAIERTSDGTRWHSFLAALSKDGMNGSWSRTALLALVRSDIAGEMLNRASTHLLDERGRLLCELIRIVMAVEVEPAAKRLAVAGVDPKLIPAGLNLPNGPSWVRLIRWVLSLGLSLPGSAIPDVVNLYTAWSVGLFGQDPLTPVLVQWLNYWLTEIENRETPFNGELTSQQIGKLAEDLRTGFLLFCNHTPTLAADYLRSLKKRRYSDQALHGILKFRGALAQAAPKELADITAELLIPKENPDDDEGSGSPFREAFGHHDLDFIPASPAQGPFFELLLHAPEHGLKLIRQLVDHAISFKSGGQDFGANVIKITSLDGGEILFPWVQSYGWSRDLGAGPAIVTSALMALEAWAHRRIEAGEPFDKVLGDIIGPVNPPAAYLLVVVDLLLSHWPKSRVAAIPFLACPELLCLDRQRMVSDNIKIPDIFGIEGLQREPVGAVRLESLKGRASRRYALDQILAPYALDEATENRDFLTELLRRAASRLGPPNVQSNLGDPEFMVVHALNLINPINWQKKSLQTDEGLTEGWEYVPPATESQHLQPLQDASRHRQTNAAMQARITLALNNPAQSSPAFAVAALTWAKSAAAEPDDDGTDQNWMREEAIFTAAMIAARDGGAEVIAKHDSWIRGTFTRALKSKNDPVHRIRAGLQFNPIAIAFVGMILLLKNRFAIEDVRTLLEVAGDHNPAAAHGFAEAAGVVASIDERLPRAILRCALAACVRPHRDWKEPEATYAAHHRKRVAIAIDAEVAWLSDKTTEPEWPEFPLEPTRSRHRIYLGGGRPEPVEKVSPPELYTDYQSAALWVGGASSLFDVVNRPWLHEIISAYTTWTYKANGSELEKNDDVEHPPREWNDVYFKLLAWCLPGLTIQQADEIALALITSLPDESFCDATTAFLRSLDTVYFNDPGLQEAQAVHIRSELARRLMTTNGWLRHSRDRSRNIEFHLGPTIAVLFFNDSGFSQPAKCYLLPKGVDGLNPFLPVLKEMAESGQFLFVALVLLNLLEVSPRTAHLPLANAAAKAWLTSNPDDNTFWVDSEIGRRLCCVMEAIFKADPKAFGIDQPLRKDIDNLLAALVRLGVPDAHRLEEALRLL
jgi:hypothetical protein